MAAINELNIFGQRITVELSGGTDTKIRASRSGFGDQQGTTTKIDGSGCNSLLCKVRKKRKSAITIISFVIALIGMLWTAGNKLGLTIGTVEEFGIISLLALLIFLYLKRTIIEESLLVVGTLGLQLSRRNGLGSQCDVQFISNLNIKSVVINETIKQHRVITYLAVMLQVPDSNGRSIIPIFKNTLPRLRSLETIYNEVHNVLNI